MTYGQAKTPGILQWHWSLDEDTSRPFIKRALDAGINFFDTANIYSNGESEEVVGRALRDFGRRGRPSRRRHARRPTPSARRCSKRRPSSTSR
jgi:aryl-alcohol dehydrogenase-like predicted oxidoreductase